MSAVSVFSVKPREPPRSGVETGSPQTFVLEANGEEEHIELRVRAGGVSSTAQQLATLLEMQKQQSLEHQRFFTEMRAGNKEMREENKEMRAEIQSLKRTTEQLQLEISKRPYINPVVEATFHFLKVEIDKPP
jgi:hypothetical protein